MLIRFGREITGIAEAGIRREWLVTNGIGGYAMGTINLTRTRRYHGLLVAATQPPTERTMMLASLDTWMELEGHRIPLITHEWATGVILPDGYRNLERFELDGLLPVWTWVHGDTRIVQRLWMVYGENTTYTTYTHIRGQHPVTLLVKPLMSYRDHHQVTKGGAQVHLTVKGWGQGQEVGILAGENLSAAGGSAPAPFYVRTNAGQIKTEAQWWWSFHLSGETQRGQKDDREDLYQAGLVEYVLHPGQTLTFIATTEEDGGHADWESSLAAERQRQNAIQAANSLDHAPEYIQQLGLAADQFIVSRRIGEREGKTVIAGYPWFTDWGRDTMIALPGLTLTTHRYAEAAQILTTFAEFVSEGMLPNRFPDSGAPEYNTVDATLWYFVAIYHYLQAQPDDSALAETLYPVLVDILDWHYRGTRYNIKVDPADNLLMQGQPDIQLTWMDVKYKDWVVTPRQGKAVEVNALWYNALCVMGWLAEKLGKESATYQKQAAQTLESFRARFWYAEGNHLYDVVDGAGGKDDATLRPNQLFAVSLPFPLIEGEQARSVVDICARFLLCSYGLRSLSPRDPNYVGRYEGEMRQREGAYHQGTVWGWLLGAFVGAHWRVYQDKAAAMAYLQPMEDHIRDYGLGSLAEIFDGDAPHMPRGCTAQAWSVSEVLRCYEMLKP